MKNKAPPREDWKYRHGIPLKTYLVRIIEDLHGNQQNEPQPKKNRLKKRLVNPPFIYKCRAIAPELFPKFMQHVNPQRGEVPSSGRYHSWSQWPWKG